MSIQPRKLRITRADDARIRAACIAIVAACAIASAAEAPSLRLLVVAPDGRTPVEGAQVHVTVDDRIATLRTGPDGAVDVALPADGVRRSLNATVTADGCVPMIINWPIDAPPASHTLRLTEGAAIGGRVVFEDGAGVSHAEVRLFVPGSLTALEQPALTDYAVQADDDGRWTCEVAPPDLERVRLQIRAPGQSYAASVTYSVGGERPIAELLDRRAVVTIERRYRLHGVVQGPDGEPVARARVLGWGVEEGSKAYAEARTDARGRFTLTDLRAGETLVLAESDAFAPKLVQAVVDPDVETAEPDADPALVVTLEPGISLAGRVVDDEGAPIEYAYVSVQRWGAVDKLAWRARTEADGGFRWDHAPDSEVILRVSARGCKDREAIALRPGPDVHEIALERVRTLIVAGSVVDAETDDPAGWFTVTPGIPDAASGETAWLDHLAVEDIGGYRIELDDRASAYVLRIEAEGYEPVVSGPFSITQGEATWDVRLAPRGAR